MMMQVLLFFPPLLLILLLFISRFFFQWSDAGKFPHQQMKGFLLRGTIAVHLRFFLSTKSSNLKQLLKTTQQMKGIRVSRPKFFQ